jgi:hypothetical protein
MPDLPTIVRDLERRLVVAEGRILGFTGLFNSLLKDDQLSAASVRIRIESTREGLEKQLADLPDAGRQLATAARDLMSDLLKDDAPAPPNLTVIDGGKSKD